MWVTKTSVMFSGGAPAARRDCGSLPAVGPTSSDEPASIRTSLFSYLIRKALIEASSGDFSKCRARRRSTSPGLAVLNQFPGQSETDGSIRKGNEVNLADLRSVNACLITIKLRHCRERYDRLVRGLLRIRPEADDEQRRRYDLWQPNVQWLEFRS